MNFNHTIYLDFISSINTNKPTDSSPESSSRSSGIYSSIDLRLSDLSSSSLSSDFHTSSQTKMFNNFHQLSSSKFSMPSGQLKRNTMEISWCTCWRVQFYNTHLYLCIRWWMQKENNPQFDNDEIVARWLDIFLISLVWLVDLIYDSSWLRTITKFISKTIDSFIDFGHIQSNGQD